MSLLKGGAPLGALVLTLVLASCGGASQSPGGGAASPRAGSSSAFPTPSAPAPIAATPAPPPEKFTNLNWGLAVFEATQSDLSQFKGIPVELTGQVFNVEQDATRVGLQMWVYPTRAEGNTVVTFPKAGFPTVTKGDTVKVAGAVDGELVRTNDKGESLHLPKVAATSVTVEGKPASPAPVPTSKVAGATVTAGSFYVVTGAPASGVNVRAEPSLRGAKKGVLHNGAVVRVTAQAAPGWDEVQGADFSGFVSRAYLTPSKTASQPLAKLSAA